MCSADTSFPRNKSALSIVLCAAYTSNAHLNAKQNEYENRSMCVCHFNRIYAIVFYSLVRTFMWIRPSRHNSIQRALHKGCRKQYQIPCILYPMTCVSSVLKPKINNNIKKAVNLFDFLFKSETEQNIVPKWENRNLQTLIIFLRLLMDWTIFPLFGLFPA